MIELKITNLNPGDDCINLNYQMQKQVQGGQGGFDEEIYNALVENRENTMITYGQVAPNAFNMDIVIDNGENNQISQDPSS
jgi:hypothetical protein